VKAASVKPIQTAPIPVSHAEAKKISAPVTSAKPV